MNQIFNESFLKRFNALSLPLALIWSLSTLGGVFLSNSPVEKYPEQFETFFELFRFGDKFGINSQNEGSLNTTMVSKTTIVPAPHRIKAIYRSSSESYVSISDGKETTIVPLQGRYKKDFTLIGVSDKAAVFRGFGKSYRLRLGFDDPLAKKETIMVALEEPNSSANHESEWRTIPRSLLVDQMRDMNQLSQYIDLKLLPLEGTSNGFKVESLASESVFAQMGVVQGDILVSVNNKKLESFGDALSIYKKVPQMRSIRITLLRNNHPKELLYEITR